ncbi:hypothetical protein VTJ04DRAFT_5812 [Mycothermus thermophilus]|uniref:uncharacterized protein n=1 Tax=Humicola insolens TaxID=85995 RepID=UPI0037421766
MKTTTFLALAAAVVPSSAAVPYTSGASRMERLMRLKEQDWENARIQGIGLFNEKANFVTISAAQKCTNGVAGGTYKCNNVDLHGFISHANLGSTGKGNDVWGWTSPTGREFGIVGQTNGVAFVEVKSDGSLTYLGRLDTQTTATSWRDIKVIGNHAYIGAESSNHGLQIFDLTKLLNITTPKVFSKTTDITHFSGFGSSHNIVASEDAKFIYAVGGQSGANARNTKCGGGLFMVDVSNPSKPTSPGCVGAAGYVHDAQCVTYTGPHAKYYGKEICFGFNEDSLVVYDMSNKASVKVVSKTKYTGNAYSHQGWLVDSSMKFLLLDDELDEKDKTSTARDGYTRTYIFNVTNLEAPFNTGIYKSPAKSIDHNQYVHEGLTYQANYGSGLRIVDVSGVELDPTGGNFQEVGFFDCYPEDDSRGGDVAFLGTWSVYPYFKSGYILLNSIERGIFSLKYTGRKAKYV